MNLESKSVDAIAAGFAALADPIRLRILSELQHGMRCVCNLLDEIDVAPNLLSYHLKVLRQAGLVEATRRGRWLDYELIDEALADLQSAVPVGDMT